MSALQTRTTLQAVATFAGIWIGLFLSICGVGGMVVMFSNKEHLYGGIAFMSAVTGFGITLVIAILKPI